jgi:tetratricopeptide (TPR) repeat protein
LLAAGLAAQKSGNYTAAAADYKAVVQASPTSSYACYAYYDLGVINQVDVSPANLPAAESYYRKCLALNPNFSDALYNVAIILTKSDPVQAEADYAQVIALAPTSVASAPAYVNLGFLLIGQGQKAQGIHDIQIAASLNPAFLKDVAAAQK